MDVSCQFHTLAPLPFKVGRWVGPRAGLDVDFYLFAVYLMTSVTQAV
jgi:hypothetical protein